MNKVVGGLLLFGILINGLSAQSSDTIKLTRNQTLITSDSLFTPKNDTIIIIPNTISYRIVDNKHILSDGFYDSIYSVASRSRITEELFNLLITHNPVQNENIAQEPVKSESFFEKFDGKTIKSLNYIPVDILDGSINDTTQKAQSKIGKLTNKLHKKIREDIIKKHLLFVIGDKVDPFEMADTERIIRSLPYIEDAKIRLTSDPNDPESVIVIVIVKERFPWSPNLSIGKGKTLRVDFINQNILGTGNEFGVGYLYSRDDIPSHGFDAKFTIRNINNSFIDATVFTSDNYLGKRTGLKLNRNFVSPNIKYNGEAIIEHSQPIQDLIFADSLYEENFNLDRKSYDIWVARSFLLGQRKSLSFALRSDYDYFSKRPIIKIDSNEVYHDHHFLVSAISFSKINYLKTKNIRSFNITEDIPIGFLFSFIVGKDWTEFGSKDYVGFLGNYSVYDKRKGYFFFDFESGYSARNGVRTNIVVQFKGRHFTPLIDLNGAYSRFFTKFHFFNANTLLIPESQSLLGENRLKDIEGNKITGDRLFTLSTEYVVFQPWYLYGFRFATYVFANVGHVRESRISNPYALTYYNFGGGIRIRNESLVFNTFEFRISVFPDLPDDGQPVYFKISSSTSLFLDSPTIKKPRRVIPR